VAKEATGLAMPAWEKVWDSDPFYTSGDPAFPALRKIAQQPLPLATSTGFAFPQTPSPGQQASVAGYVLTDMMQQVAQGRAAKDAVAAAHDRMVQIFEQQGLKQ
jgi:multiple sugar transport system substrate-binding protein